MFSLHKQARPAVPPPHPVLTLGTLSGDRHGRSCVLVPEQVRTSWRIYGLSGFGKSSLELSLMLQMLAAHEAFSLIDPHSDLAVGLLHALRQTNFYADERAYDRLWYIDWSRTDRVVPFNILDQPYGPYITAQNIAQAFHRAWPNTDKGNAPLFDTILLASLVVLAFNHKPITALIRLITNRDWRTDLLRQVPDEQIVSFFRDRFDTWGKGVTIESTARRLNLLTFHPVLRHALGCQNNAINPRQLMDRGTSVLHDLGGLDAETQRFIGCLLAVGYEQAALSRADMPEHSRRPHHLLLEEFPSFVSTNEQSLERTLAQTRKYAMFTALINQTNSQVGRALQGAMGNIGVEIAFRLNPDDAREAAPRFTRYDARRLTYHSPRGAPSYASRGEQVQEIASLLQTLPRRQALVRFGDHIAHIEALTVPTRVDHEALLSIKEEYARRLLVPIHEPIPVPQETVQPHHRQEAARAYQYFIEE